MAIYFDKNKDEIVCRNCNNKLFTEKPVSMYTHVPEAPEPTVKRTLAHIELTCNTCGTVQQLSSKTQIID